MRIQIINVNTYWNLSNIIRRLRRHIFEKYYEQDERKFEKN